MMSDDCVIMQCDPAAYTFEEITDDIKRELDEDIQEFLAQSNDPDATDDNKPENTTPENNPIDNDEILVEIIVQIKTIEEKLALIARK